MSLTALLRILARRWVLVVPATLLVIVAVTAVGRAMAATHEATAIAIVLPGTADVTRSAVEEGAAEEDEELRTPYMRIGGGERLAAEALVKSVQDVEFTGDVDVELHPTLPMLRITTTGVSAEAVESRGRDALAAIRDHFQVRQRARAVPPELWLRLDTVAEPAAQRINENRMRAMTAIGVVGALGVIGLGLVAERAALVLRRVRAATMTQDRGPVSVLFGFAIVLVIVPQIHSIGPFAITGAMIVAAVAGGLWAAGRFLPGALPDRMTGVGVALTVFIAVALASYGLAQLRPLETLEAGAADRRIAFLVAFSGITLLAADGLRSSRQVHRLLLALAVIGSVHALVGVLQLGGLDIPGLTRIHSPRGGFPRIAGTARHPIDFGVFSAAMLPLALHFAAFAAARRVRLAAAAGAATLAAGAALSVTRSALLGLVVGTVVLLAGRQGRRRWGLIAAGVAALLLAPLAVPDFTASVSEMVVGAPESPSVQSRVADYEPLFNHVARHPFLGRGTGTFEPSVHFVLDNNYLSLLVETGIVGLASFVVILGAAWVAVRQVRRRTTDRATRDAAQAIGAAIAVLAVCMGTYDLLAFQLGGGSLFLLLGCAAALARLTPPAGPPTPEPAATTAEPAERAEPLPA